MRPDTLLVLVPMPNSQSISLFPSGLLPDPNLAIAMAAVREARYMATDGTSRTAGTLKDAAKC